MMPKLLDDCFKNSPDGFFNLEAVVDGYIYAQLSLKSPGLGNLLHLAMGLGAKFLNP